MKLVHYTNSIDAINGILKNGLLMNPLERKLIHLFSNSPLFQAREPQQFGLTSLRRDTLIGSKKHIMKFGNLGIVFNHSWIKKENFLKVQYLKKDTRKFNQLKDFFNQAEKELIECIRKRGSDDAFLDMAYTNKAISELIGAKKYSDFLSIYEYLEPESNKWQREYRSVQKEPLYSTGSTGELVNRISFEGWDRILMTKKFTPEDVSHFITQRDCVKKLKESLPVEFQNKDVKWKLFI